MTDAINTGLEGVIVGQTELSNVEGDVGRLTYRGESIDTLVERDFPAVIIWLMAGHWISPDECRELDKWLADESELSAVEHQVLAQLPRDTHPMAVLQALTPIAHLEPMRTPPTWLEQTWVPGLVLAARINAAVRIWHNLATHGAPFDVPDGLGFLEKLLYGLNREAPGQGALKAINTTQILQLDHSFNAGTFAGRVIASTGASLSASIAGSLGALSGPLHGGADEAAVMMARDIGDASRADTWVRDALANKVKIMGMGHREYKRLDPRAAILKPMAKHFCEGTQWQPLMETLMAVEDTCQAVFSEKGKEIHANLEFYKGAVYLALGVQERYFTSLFACSRVFGWISHFHEFNRAPRLIRPRALYSGR
ncbi:citrate/2-methylcitrate synthase [Saccharospirillum salsuginis]|uniref:Citrate synthase n=1 Tax=Saccharospirillum salsuginis TaxID=418750 RepID=A0A918KJJ7_9GAMM|nr:citrate/2-methylcitrate synthase [Saccharospirillum salsuginis]GGX64131.1 citrate synthase [Saccharospirillum salsuginis]